MSHSQKILMIHQHYFPEMTGTARRTKELAESFVKKGHKVSVVTTFPREFRSMHNVDYKGNEVLNGVSVYRVRTLFQVEKNVLIRMLSYLVFVLKSLNCALKLSKHVDIVISIAPLPSAVIGSLIRVINKKHHHFDVPDILPDLGISAGMIKNKIIIKLLYKLEKWTYGQSDSISAITHGQINNIHNKGVPKEKLSYIPDWIDDKFFKQYLSQYLEEVSCKQTFANKKLISFVGNIGALQNPKVFINLMKKFNDDGYNNYNFLFIGDGIMLSSLKDEVNELKLDNVKFLGRVDREKIPAYMFLSDLLVANYLPNEYMDICIPGKLFEYAISNKPIVMGARGEAKSLIEKYDLGLTVPPSDVNGFSDAIIRILDGSFKFNPNSEKFIKDFSLENISKLYDRIFNQVN